jgi:hypothetical protein
MQPLEPRRKWLAITVATLVLVPAFWAMLAGLVAVAVEGGDGGGEGGPRPVAALALGLALLPFVFVILAFMTEQPRPPTAVLRAMGLSLLVGVVVSAVAGDAVTGLVAGTGAGGIAAIRSDEPHSVRGRWVAVGVACLYTFVLVRVAAGLALLPAPIFPFTAVGIADHVAEWRRAKA